MSALIGIAIFILILRATPSIVKRIEGGGMDFGSKARVDEVERRLQETQDRLRELATATDTRLVDLEERQDFTERILQQGRSTNQLPDG